MTWMNVDGVVPLHGHPGEVVTFTANVPPFAGTFTDGGETEYAHVVAAVWKLHHVPALASVVPTPLRARACQ